MKPKKAIKWSGVSSGKPYGGAGGTWWPKEGPGSSGAPIQWFEDEWDYRRHLAYGACKICRPPLSVGLLGLLSLAAWASYRFVFATASSAMTSKSQQPEGRDGTLSTLDVAIDVMNFAKGVSVIAPAQAAFGSVSAILTMIRVHSFLFCGDRLPVHVYPGFYGRRRGLC